MAMLSTFLSILLSSEGVVRQGSCPVPPGWGDNLFNQVGTRRAKETYYLMTLHLKPAIGGGTCMGSGENKPQPKLSLELNQEKQPKKKGLWQKLIEVAERLIKEEEERKDPSYW